MLQSGIASNHLTKAKLSPGFVIQKSCRITPGTYHFKSGKIAQPIIRISGNHIKVDFSGVRLVGDRAKTLPNERTGLGLEITGNDITISGLKIRGYKVAILAKGCHDLKILHCDFSWNFKQHLGSTLVREDINDWESYHHNEHDEWFRYGAGAYLKNCDHFEVRGCVGTGEQCGLDLVKSNHGLVWDNNFSFNSGLGIGMYRSSFNRIMQNKMDWDVRGYSFGVYNRGQDSAGILVYEQSSHNIIAYNSITQGGDGFFLWAGQSTMDTGKGGCNDNLVYGNDFSGAVTNGIEATFSRNKFINNLCVECDYGLWGGYSFDSIIKDNIFALCNTGSAIEHGQNNQYKGNLFEDDRPAIQLWAHPITGGSSGYTKFRDTKSENVLIQSNRFKDCFPEAVNVMETKGISLIHNVFVNTKPILEGDQCSGMEIKDNSMTSAKSPSNLAMVKWRNGSREYLGDISRYLKGIPWNPFQVKNAPVRPLKGGINPYLRPGTFRGRRSILVNEWGPYDFRYPIFWWWNGPSVPSDRIVVLRVLGPKGKYKIDEVQGATLLTAKSGTTPGTLRLKVDSGQADRVKVRATYIGGATVNQFGVPSPAGKPIRFSYSQSFFLLNWTLDYFQWHEATSPINHLNAFEKLVSGKPIVVQHLSQIKFGYTGGWPASIPNRHYAVVARTQFNCKAGSYKLSLTGDDGIRCFLDGKLVPMSGPDGKIQNSFIYQGATTYTATLHLSKGDHRLRVEYFQIDGGRALDVALRPVN